jgi:thiol-disulfide isomerase/thioredoxin
MIAVVACLVVLGFVSIANLLLTVALAQRLAQARAIPIPPGMPAVGVQQPVGSALPEFSVLTAEGLSCDSAELQDTTVLFGFFSTDCGGCRDAMPEFAAHARIADGVVLAVVAGDSTVAGELAAPLRGTGAWLVVGVGAATIQTAFGVDLYPQFYRAVNGKISSAGLSLRQLRASLAVS